MLVRAARGILPAQTYVHDSPATLSMEDPHVFIGHLNAARPLLASIEAEPALLSSSECHFIAQWICTHYPVACAALEELPSAVARTPEKSGPLATLAGANALLARVRADKRRKSMLPAPPLNLTSLGASLQHRR